MKGNQNQNAQSRNHKTPKFNSRLSDIMDDFKAIYKSYQISFILWLVLSYTSMISVIDILRPYTHMSYSKVWFISTILYVAVIFLALSKTLEKVLLFCNGARRVATNTEKARLHNIWLDVVKKMSCMGPLPNVTLYLADNIQINACAYSHSVVLNRGVLDNLNDDEIKGILAHELSHIIYHDTQAALLVTFGSYFIATIMYVISLILNLIIALIGESIISKIIKGLANIFNFLFQYFILSIFIIFKFLQREQEYRADALAAEAGFKNGLLSSLYVLYYMQVSDNKKVLDRFMDTHPKLAYRIERLEMGY